MLSRWIKSNLPKNSSSSSPLQTLSFSTTAMEIELILLLPNSTSHQKLSHLLSPHHHQTLLQQNLFFDTPSLSLSTSHLSSLRLRFDPLPTLTLKSNPHFSNGITYVEELEEPLDPALARSIAADPRLFKSVEGSKVLQKVVSKFGVELYELIGLGGFRNVRNVYMWEGLKLELDETRFDFGVCYEVECESEEPEKAKRMVEGLLKENGIGFRYNKKSKFAVFRDGKVPEF